MIIYIIIYCYMFLIVQPLAAFIGYLTIIDPLLNLFKCRRGEFLYYYYRDELINGCVAMTIILIMILALDFAIIGG